MLSYLLESLKKIDRFGAIFRPAFVDLHPEYRSFIGGIATLIIYGLSFSYFCYQIAQWQSNSLLPKITITQTSYDYKEYFAQENFSSFYMRRSNVSKQLDPFDPQNLILQPIIYTFKNTQLNSSQSFSFNEKSARYNNTQIFISNISFVLNIENTFNNPQLDYFLTFGPCLESYLLPDQKCANQTIVNAFMAQSTNIIIVNQYVQEYNTKLKKLVTVPRESFTFLSNTTTFYSQNQIKLGETNVDNGFLFESYTKYQFISDVEVVTQQLQLEQSLKTLGRPTYLVYHYRIGQIMQTQFIEYPKISEVLADIGSITSLILLLSCLFTFFNEQELEKKSITKVIEMYYPEMANIRYGKNWYGKTISVFYNEIQIDQDEFYKYYNRLQQIATKKLSISNILFALSKIQFLVQSNYDREEIKLAHNIGIKVKQFKKIQTEREIDQSQTNLQVVEMDDSKIHCNKTADLTNNNAASNETIAKINQERILFIPPSKAQCRLLTDEDFQLFTMEETYEFDQEQLKLHQYYQQNFIGI